MEQLKIDQENKFKHEVTLQERELEHQLSVLFNSLKKKGTPKGKVIQHIGNIQQRLNDLTAVVAESYPIENLDSN